MRSEGSVQVLPRDFSIDEIANVTVDIKELLRSQNDFPKSVGRYSFNVTYYKDIDNISWLMQSLCLLDDEVLICVLKLGNLFNFS